MNNAVIGTKGVANPSDTGVPSLSALMTRARWIEVGRILLTGLIALLYWQQWVPVKVLWVGVAIGLYPLVKTGLLDLIREPKIGTEILVAVPTLVAVLDAETVAGAVSMVIILIAEFIADLKTDRARGSIKSLIGSVPQVALVRGAGGERSIPIGELRAGDIVLVRAGEKIPVDRKIADGTAFVDEAPTTGESLPKEKNAGDLVFAGTVIGQFKRIFSSTSEWFTPAALQRPCRPGSVPFRRPFFTLGRTFWCS